MEQKFPSGFLWGAATSSHQVEGGNTNDWTEWEQKMAKSLSQRANSKNWPDFILKNYPNPLQPANYISGQACDHYNRFREDFDIAKSLGHNAHRFSIEWSRVEPEEGKFDEVVIEHYREVVKSLRERGLEPFVTLWHFTNPLWISKIGDWTNKKTIDYFVRYVRKMVEALTEINFWITLNEPDDIYTFYAYCVGKYPPQEKSFIKTWLALRNLILAHKKAYRVIHQHNSSAMVSFANNTIYFESRGVIARIIKIFANAYWNFYFLRKTLAYNDFIGCNFYHHNVLKGVMTNQNKNVETTDVGWEILPKGIYHVLKDLKKYNKPIYITENGLADAKDDKRTQFIEEHLKWIYKAISENVDIRGYFHWSLLDNFEWDKGFWPRFGLVEVNYQTLERKIRPSALAYAKICRTNKIESF
ncbi:MAG: glycoside hydrolase family 1 protein [Patescibacteria group bacterium]